MVATGAGRPTVIWRPPNGLHYGTGIYAVLLGNGEKTSTRKISTFE
jgi:hypothetical protein